MLNVVLVVKVSKNDFFKTQFCCYYFHLITKMFNGIKNRCKHLSQHTVFSGLYKSLLGTKARLLKGVQCFTAEPVIDDCLFLWETILKQLPCYVTQRLKANVGPIESLLTPFSILINLQFYLNILMQTVNPILKKCCSSSQAQAGLLKSNRQETRTFSEVKWPLCIISACFETVV